LHGSGALDVCVQARTDFRLFLIEPLIPYSFVLGTDALWVAVKDFRHFGIRALFSGIYYCCCDWWFIRDLS